jgi:hypothetical protein
VQRLVQPESSPAGQVDGGDEPPALLCHAAAELDAPGFELAPVELIAARYPQTWGARPTLPGERVDEPAVTGVDRFQPQDVGEEGPVGGCINGVEDRERR